MAQGDATDSYGLIGMSSYWLSYNDFAKAYSTLEIKDDGTDDGDPVSSGYWLVHSLASKQLRALHPPPRGY